MKTSRQKNIKRQKMTKIKPNKMNYSQSYPQYPQVKHEIKTR